MEISELMAEYE